MDKKFYEETFDMFIETWGKEFEMQMCIEEMSELTKELCKFMRYSQKQKSPENQEKLEQIKRNIIEETADVLICAGQMKRLFGSVDVDKVADYKIQRGRAVVETFNQNKKGK